MKRSAKLIEIKINKIGEEFMNEVFDKLVKSKIEKFVFDYKSLSREVFVNEKGDLKHPAEFGIYREKIIKHLIQPFLPSRLAIGTGFIITSKNETSTQCDLIIYDKDNTPVIENEEQRFFPIECVVGVIEVKSRLDKSKLKEALIKLSEIKKLRESVSSNIYNFKNGRNDKPFSPKAYGRDQIATFLICESIEMNIKQDINTFFKDTYNCIDKSLFHNMILSIDNGIFLYNDGNLPIYHSYYDYSKEAFKNQFICPHVLGYHYEHILLFVNYFYMIISSISVLYIEMTQYLGVIRGKSSIIEDK